MHRQHKALSKFLETQQRSSRCTLQHKTCVFGRVSPPQAACCVEINSAGCNAPRLWGQPIGLCSVSIRNPYATCTSRLLAVSSRCYPPVFVAFILLYSSELKFSRAVDLTMVIKKPNSNTIVPHFSGRPSTMSQSTVLPSAPVSGLAPAATPIAPRPLKRIVVIPRQPTKITNIASVQPMKRTAPVAPTVVPMKKKLIVTPPVVATPPKADISTVESLLNKDAEKKPNTVRKRQNLSNMSAQQRQERRMLMNRTAAQNARDRKKRHNERLEVAVRELLNETRYLRSRVVELENRLNNANQLISQNGLSTSQSAPNATSVQQSLDPIGFAEIIHGPQRRERESKVQWTSATWALVNESTRRLEVQDLAVRLITSLLAILFHRIQQRTGEVFLTTSSRPPTASTSISYARNFLMTDSPRVVLMRQRILSHLKRMFVKHPN
uniref:X-box-binding protein 1 n=1 Tax=Panagrellus redivivus TaxID=6233 RepID=A0A7E4W073_PANRE